MVMVVDFLLLITVKYQRSYDIWEYNWSDKRRANECASKTWLLIINDYKWLNFLDATVILHLDPVGIIQYSLRTYPLVPGSLKSEVQRRFFITTLTKATEVQIIAG